MDFEKSVSGLSQEELERLISNRLLPTALEWIEEDPEHRRLGESKEGYDSSKIRKISEGWANSEIKGVWIAGVKKDEDGSYFAAELVYEPPHKKGRRRNFFIGVNISARLAGMGLVEDTGEKYFVKVLPSATQVTKALKTMRETM